MSSMFDYFLEQEELNNDFNGYDETELEEAAEEHLDSVIMIECQEENPFEACLRIANECVINHHNIINAMAMEELSYLKENGTVLNEEAEESKKSARAVVVKIRQAIGKFLGKIQGVVSNLFNKIDEWVAADKRWVKMHEKKAQESDGKTVKGSFYNYSNLDDKGLYSIFTVDMDFAAPDGRKSNVKAYDKSAFKEDLYKKACNSNATNDSDFKKDLAKHFRSGGTIIGSMKFSWSESKNIILNTSTTKKDIKKAYDDLRKNLKTLDMKIMAAERKVKDDKDQTKVNKAYFSALSEQVAISTSVAAMIFKEQTRAIMERHKMHKAMVGAAAKVNKKDAKEQKKANNESAWYIGAADII